MDELDDTKVPDEALEKTARLPRIIFDDGKEEEFRAGQSKILEMIAANKSLSEILDRLVLLIEDQAPGMLGSILLLSEDGDHIKHGAAPSLPINYVRAIDGLAIGPKTGSCGTAMYRGQPVIVSDIMTDPLWAEYKGFADAAGLRACWSTPIMSGRGKVLGTFAMYYREPRSPTGDEASLTEVATRIAGIAIEHQAARETLARTKVELAKATHTATSAEAAASTAPEVTHLLDEIVATTDAGVNLLNEDEPDLVRLREVLAKINRHGKEALNVLARIPRK